MAAVVLVFAAKGRAVGKSNLTSGDREISRSNTWVSVLSQEMSLNNRYVETVCGQQDEEQSKVHWVSIFSDDLVDNHESDFAGNGVEETRTWPGPEPEPKPKPKPKRYLLEIREGSSDSSSLRKHRIQGEGRITVGRANDNDVVLADAGASRKHFFLEVLSSRVALVDCASENGTRVNGVRVDRCELVCGDRIEVGKALIVFAAEEPKIGGERIDDTIRYAVPLDSGMIEGTRTQAKAYLDDRRAKGAQKSNASSAPAVDSVARQMHNKQTDRHASRKEDRGKHVNVAFAVFAIGLLLSLISSGGLAWQFFEHRRQALLWSFFKTMEGAFLIAALGDAAEGKAIGENAYRLLEDDAYDVVSLRSSDAFFEAMEVLQTVDTLAADGKFDEAIKRLGEANSIKLSVRQSEAAQKSFDRRRQLWGRLMNGKSTEVASVKAESARVAGYALEPKQKWVRAISLFKTGKKIDACNLIGEIIGEAKGQLLAKARSFFGRKCS